MNILGISGGRINGNNEVACKEALLAAQKMGCTVTFVRLLDLNIKNCTGCCTCMRSLNLGKGDICTLHDDFEWLREKVLDADGVLFAMPVFERGAPGIFHTLLDRFGPRHDRGTNLVGLRIAQETGGVIPDPRVLKEKAVSYIGIGGSDWTTNFQSECALLSTCFMWKTIDNVVFQWNKLFVMDDASITKAHKIGENLASAVKDLEYASYQGDPGICPHCHSRNFHMEDHGGRATCSVCGITGNFQMLDGTLRFVFSPDQETRAGDVLTGKLLHAEDIRFNQEIRLKLQAQPEYEMRSKKYRNCLAPCRPKR